MELAMESAGADMEEIAEGEDAGGEGEDELLESRKSFQALLVLAKAQFAFSS